MSVTEDATRSSIDRRLNGEPNVTALIDVLLVPLLIFKVISVRDERVERRDQKIISAQTPHSTPGLGDDTSIILTGGEHEALAPDGKRLAPSQLGARVRAA